MKTRSYPKIPAFAEILRCGKLLRCSFTAVNRAARNSRASTFNESGNFRTEFSCRRPSRLKFSLFVAIVPLIAGCSLGPDYRPPELEVTPTYREPVPSGESIANINWWDVYEDQVLQGLIRRSLEENKDLQTALARIDESSAVLGFVRADQFPEVNVRGGVGKKEFGESASSGFPRNVEGYSGALAAFFEIDFWGKFRRATEAARANLLSTEEAYRAVTISLVSDVASTYFLLRDFDERLVIAKRTLESRRESTKIIRARYSKGTVALLDVNQAEIEEQDTAATVQSFVRGQVRTENALSVLLGRPPGDIPRGTELYRQQLPAEIPVGLPSELIQRRPDVLSAEQQLVAQTALIGVAEALRFPSISLTAAFGVETNDLSSLSFSRDRFWSAGADLIGPLISYDRNVSRVDIEKARTEQLLLSYQQTVLRAFQEVEDALVSVRTFREEYEHRRKQVEAAKSAAYLSRALYDGGQTSYLEVLDSERSLFSSELQAAEVKRQHYVAIVQLYKALGGGWNQEEG